VVAAGLITQDQGWRWVWIWCAIFFGVQVLMFALGFEETKFTRVGTLEARQGSVVVAEEATTTEMEGEKVPVSTPPSPPEPLVAENDTAAARALSVTHIDHRIPRKSYRQRLSLLKSSPGPWSHFLRHSWQPFVILVTIPGVTFCALVYAITLAWQTVMTTAVSTYMLDPPYEFNAAQIGLMNLPPFIGNTLGAIIIGPLSDWIALHLARRNNGIYEPEMRFWVFLPFVPFQLAGTAEWTHDSPPSSQVANVKARSMVVRIRFGRRCPMVPGRCRLRYLQFRHRTHPVSGFDICARRLQR